MVDPPKTRLADPRKARARQTRRRMVEAAYRLFCERGYGVPLTDVATEAGVAVQTIYFTFHTKVELLSAALELAVLGDGEARTPTDQEWFQNLMAEPDPRHALAHMIEGTSQIYPRVAPLNTVFRTGDKDVQELWRHGEELRVQGYRRIIDALAAKGPFRPGLDVDSALDILLVLMSPDLYTALTAGRGWTHERWLTWIKATLAEALYGPGAFL